MSNIAQDYSFGGWLRTIRLSKGFTLRKAAQEMGMNAGNLSRLERSELNPPKSAYQIELICDALGCGDEVKFLKSLAFQFHLAVLTKEFNGDADENSKNRRQRGKQATFQVLYK